MRDANEGAGTGGRKKRMPGCNGRDRGCNITLPEREQTSVWSFFAREFEKFLKGVKQMNRKLCAAPHAGQRWQDIDFANVEKCVKKLQMRIAKAAKEEKWGKVKALQWTLTHSYYAKVLAVKQVTENLAHIAAVLLVFSIAGGYNN